MQAKDIKVGDDYAYVENMSDGQPHLLNAEVIEAPRSGSVKVRIEHPDEHVEPYLAVEADDDLVMARCGRADCLGHWVREDSPAPAGPQAEGAGGEL